MPCSAALPPSPWAPPLQIHDVIETLGRVHGSHRKLLRARHARLWVCLEKMGSAETHVELTSAHVQALHEDMEGKRRELVRIDQRVAEVEKFVDTLKIEVGRGWGGGWGGGRGGKYVETLKTAGGCGGLRGAWVEMKGRRRGLWRR